MAKRKNAILNLTEIAGARLAALNLERERILMLFPTLNVDTPAPVIESAPSRRKKGRVVSAEMRKAISERMKRYWSIRRKQKK